MREDRDGRPGCQGGRSLKGRARGEGAAASGSSPSRPFPPRPRVTALESRGAGRRGRAHRRAPDALGPPRAAAVPAPAPAPEGPPQARERVGGLSSGCACATLGAPPPRRGEPGSLDQWVNLRSVTSWGRKERGKSAVAPMFLQQREG